MEDMAPRAARDAYASAEAETHSGLIFFVVDRAYKLKTAVDSGFLDFASRANIVRLGIDPTPAAGRQAYAPSSSVRP